MSGFRSVLGAQARRAGGAGPADLAEIDRHNRKERAYTAKEPLCALYAFGREARTRVWAVLDKSEPDAPRCDVLSDRNEDGDLTGPGERNECKPDGDRMTFAVGRLTDPLTKQEHMDVVVARVEGEDARIMFHMTWSAKELVRDG